MPGITLYKMHGLYQSTVVNYPKVWIIISFMALIVIGIQNMTFMSIIFGLSNINVLILILTKQVIESSRNHALILMHNEDNKRKQLPLVEWPWFESRWYLFQLQTNFVHKMYIYWINICLYSITFLSICQSVVINYSLMLDPMYVNLRHI